jgi:hypothetical protein
MVARTSIGFAPVAAKKRQWTVLVYQDANSDLAPYIKQNLADIKKAGSSRDVQVAVQTGLGGKPKSGGDQIRRYEIKAGGGAAEVARFRGRTRDGKTLQDFVAWGMRTYPAEHTMVIVSGHGEGYIGICTDKGGDKMPLTVMHDALQGASKEAGRPVDVLAFDACHMGQAEVLHEIGHDIPFVIGSEEIVGLVGLPYPQMLAALQGEPAMAPREVAACMVEVARQDEVKRRNSHADEAAYTLAAYDTSAFKTVRERMDDLAGAILASKVNRNVFRCAIKITQRYARGSKVRPYADFRDVGAFAKQLLRGAAATDEAVSKSARALLDGLDELVIAEEHAGEGMGHSHGLSAYLPAGVPDAGHADFKAYQATGFAHDTRWDEMLCALGQA